MQVQYRETKSGFECIHMPSIDVTTVNEPQPSSRRSQHRKQGSSGSHETDGRKSVTRKSSKLSFGKKKDKQKDSQSDKEKELPSRPSGGTVLSMTPSSASSSFFHVSSNAHNGQEGNRPADANDTALSTSPSNEHESSPPRSHSPGGSKILPPIPRDYAGAKEAAATPFPTGEVDQEVFDTLGMNSLAVRFEINVVKVCSF